jgi:hypothetical protein
MQIIYADKEIDFASKMVGARFTTLPATVVLFESTLALSFIDFVSWMLRF